MYHQILNNFQKEKQGAVGFTNTTLDFDMSVN